MTKKKHSRFSASGSSIWLNCAGSVQLSEKAPPETESPYALEGTSAHGVLEKILRAKLPRVTALELAKKHDTEMVNHALSTYKYIKDNLELSKDAKLLVETKVDLSFIHKEMFGTLDAAIVDEFNRLHVIDYKYGQGYAVDPDNNSQLIYYALGIAYEYNFNFEQVFLTIVQPRAEHDKGPIRTWAMSIDDLMNWRDTFDKAVKAALAKNPELTPGEHCRWCKAKPICPALSTQALEQAKIDFTDSEVRLPAHNLLGVETLSNTLKALDKIEIWTKAVREYAFERLSHGGTIPGFKLVQKRATRKWINEEKITKEAERDFGPIAFSEPKLLSPAQLEKAGADPHWIEQRVIAESSGLTMVSDDDKRSAHNQLELDFGDSEKEKTKQPKLSKGKRK